MQVLDAAYNNFEVNEYERFSNNSKEIQVTPETISVGTQTISSYKDVSVQYSAVMRDKTVSCVSQVSDAETMCNISFEQPSDDEEFYDDMPDDFDSSFHVSQSETESDNEMENRSFSFQKKCPGKKVIDDTSTSFIVYWSCLSLLLKICLTCGASAVITKKIVYGSALFIELLCSKDHYIVWRSQPVIRGFNHGNIKMAASVLFSGNTFMNLWKYFQTVGLAWISKSSYYQLQKKYFLGVANEAWDREHTASVSELKKQNGSFFSGDGRCDSPGHNAKYLTYSFLDQQTNKIVEISLTQVTEAGNSNRMEKYGFKKVLQSIKDSDINITKITTDRHIQVKKYLREEEQDIEHQFDVWHFSKNIKKKLLAASKKRNCNALTKWIKSIINHFWWACATCNGEEELLKEKWTSVIFHVQNKHSRRGYKHFKKCIHPTITKKTSAH